MRRLDVRLACAAVAMLASGVVSEAWGQTGLRPVLVELFTSEGCSSCPPADALLRQIDAQRTVGGQLVVGISEHVTYWNHGGWTDPLSDEIYTRRQEGYRSRFDLESAYTPQMVVNGEHEVLGSDRGAVTRAIGEAGRVGDDTVHIVSVVVVGDRLRVTYSTHKGKGGDADLFAVVAENSVTSKVPRGENSGRTLTHVSVAQSLTRIGAMDEVREKTVELPLSRSAGKRHVILFAQKKGLGPVVAVDLASI